MQSTDLAKLLQEAWSKVSDTNPTMFASLNQTGSDLPRLVQAVHEALRAQQELLVAMTSHMQTPDKTPSEPPAPTPTKPDDEEPSKVNAAPSEPASPASTEGPKDDESKASLNERIEDLRAQAGLDNQPEPKETDQGLPDRQRGQ